MSQAQDPQALYEQANSFLQNGQLAKAEPLYLQLIDALPLSPEPRSMLGILRLQQGRNREALDLIEAALKLGPNNAETHFNLGNALKGLGRFQEALSAYDKALAINPQSVGANYNRALLQQELGHLEAALAGYDRTLALQPIFVEALYNRGVLLIAMNRDQDALVSLDLALTQRPDFAEVWNNRGRALRNLGRDEEALASFDQAVAIRPEFVNAFLNRADLSHKQFRRIDMALADYEKALKIRPDFPGSHYNRAVLLQEAGRFEEALASYDAALALKPDYVEALHNRSSLLLDMKRDAKALADIDRALSSWPGRAEIWNNRGTALRNLHRHDEALASFDRALAIDPEYPIALCNRASLLFEVLKRSQEAMVIYDHVLALKPDLAEAWNYRGNVLRVLRRPAEALTSFDKALLLRPDYADALKSRCQSFFEMNRIDDGIEAARDAAARIYGDGQSPLGGSGSLPPHKMQHDREQHHYLQSRKGVAADRPGGRLPGPAVRPGNGVDETTAQWLTEKPQIAVIDNFLTPEALDGLRRFCWEEPVWRASYQNGYLGAFPEQGFACPLLGQIADELRKAFPGIFLDHPLNYLWGFKYDSQLRGIAIHADQAAVNVNFWITPDDANLDPQSGGLVVWDVAAPLEWDFAKFNNDAPAIRDFLARNGAKAIKVPYRSNRAVIFDSDLFHETDTIRFRDGYLDRRINVTMLYGQRC